MAFKYLEISILALAWVLPPNGAHAINLECSEGLGPQSQIEFVDAISLSVADKLLDAGDLFGAQEAIRDSAASATEPQCNYSNDELRRRLLIARVEVFRGQVGDARIHYANLVKPITTRYGSLSEVALLTRIRLANIRLEQGEATEALKDLIQIQGDFQLVSTPSKHLAIQVGRSLAVALAMNGDGPKASAIASGLHAIAPESGDGYSLDSADVDELIAALLTRDDAPAKALLLQSRAYVYRAAHSSGNNLALLTSLWRVGYSLNQVGRTQVAQEIFESIDRRIGDSVDPAYARLKIQVESRLGNISAQY